MIYFQHTVKEVKISAAQIRGEIDVQSELGIINTRQN